MGNHNEREKLVQFYFLRGEQRRNDFPLNTANEVDMKTGKWLCIYCVFNYSVEEKRRKSNSQMNTHKIFKWKSKSVAYLIRWYAT